MKVLAFEDNDEKFESLSQGLQAGGVESGAVTRARSLGSGLRSLRQGFDLFVIDLWLPYVDGGEAFDVANDVVSLIEQESNLSVPIIAITSYAAEAARHGAFLAGKGVHIYDYYAEDIWKRALSVYIQQAKDRHRYDFLIFTALSEERKIYAAFEGMTFRSVTRAGLDCWEFDWRGLRGAVVLFPRMGLVTAAVATARMLANYVPKVVCMSGICGGIGPDTYLGQVLVAELCWEYQSGKWTNEIFTSEPYQVEVADSLKLAISRALEKGHLERELEAGFDHGERPSRTHSPRLAIFATGSAVIASEERLKHVKEQHRKVAGIDMEIYGFYRAVRMFNEDIKFFAAKAVVDKADIAKGDALHAYGSYVSAKFCLHTVSLLLGLTD